MVGTKATEAKATNVSAAEARTAEVEAEAAEAEPAEVEPVEVEPAEALARGFAALIPNIASTLFINNGLARAMQASTEWRSMPMGTSS
jgi:hypothetical protein